MSQSVNTAILAFPSYEMLPRLYVPYGRRTLLSKHWRKVDIRIRLSASVISTYETGKFASESAPAII
jgi:hypothetical protein